jgi:hypothetical protein
MTLREVLYSLATRPVDLLVRRWNWKAALFSSLIRGIVFCWPTCDRGGGRLSAPCLPNGLTGALMSGFYGSTTQALSQTEPESQGAAAMILLPLS